VVKGKPPENRITILRPGTLRRFLARLRTASSMLRAPKSASALLSDDIPMEEKFVGPRGDEFVEASATEVSGEGAFGSTEEFFMPETAA
jgi:hypothetical protein